MKRIFIILSLIFFFHAGIGSGGEILVVQSVGIQPYDEALKGFQDVGHPRFKRAVIADMAEKDLNGVIRHSDPPLILAIGMDALSKVSEIKDIPVIYLMVLNPPAMVTGKENITGIAMNIPPDRQMALFSNVMPEIKNIGLVYDPDNTGHFVKEALEEAGNFGINLVTEKAGEPSEVPSLVMDMTEEIDAFWMLPDITVATPETIEFLLLTSLRQRIPIITFSEKYLEIGALISVGIDPYDMGNQAGEIAHRILSEGDPGNFREVSPRKAVVSINPKIAEKLKIVLDKDLVVDARIIE